MAPTKIRTAKNRMVQVPVQLKIRTAKNRMVQVPVQQKIPDRQKLTSSGSGGPKSSFKAEKGLRQY